MKSSMQTRLIMISSGMLVLAIACICFANIFWLPYYYQSEKVSNMKNAYNNVVKQVSGVEWGSISEDELDNTYDALVPSIMYIRLPLRDFRKYPGSSWENMLRINILVLPWEVTVRFLAGHPDMKCIRFTITDCSRIFWN